LRRTAWSRSQTKDVALLKAKTECLERLLAGEDLSKAVGSIGNSWNADVLQLKASRQHLTDIYRCIDASWGCQCSEEHAVNFQLCSDPYQAELHLLFAPTASTHAATTSPLAKWNLQSLQANLRSQDGKDNKQTTAQPQNCELCKSFEQRSTNPTHAASAGPLPLRDKGGREYELRKAEEIAQQTRFVPLKDVLKPSTGLTHRTSARARVELGAILLNAVLQHHSTTWLPPTWNSSNIYLIQESGSPTQTALTKAYLEARFSKLPATPTTKPWKQPCVRNLTLHNLAIVLIELAYSQPLEDLMNDEEREIAKQAIGGQYARLQAADRLVEELPDHLLLGSYCQAARMCLSGEFGVLLKGKELSDEDLFGAVYRMAVKPLMDALGR
jgi:hypothetical protein